MDMLASYAALSISFVMLASIMLWVFIKADNISWKKKLLTIPIVLIYSIVLLFTMSNYDTGLPSGKVEGMHQVIILWHDAVESEDMIVFTVINYNRRNVIARYFPKHPDADKQDIPRYIYVKYNSDVFKALIAMVAEMEKMGRGRMIGNMEKLDGFNALTDLNNPFDLQDPMEMLKKAPQE